MGEAASVLGWAALSPVSSRCVYAGVAESCSYVAAKACGQGVGRQLLQALLLTSKTYGIWTLPAGTFAEHMASIGLHIQAGSWQVGRRERLGQHHGVWQNTVQVKRRSSTVGAA